MKQNVMLIPLISHGVGYIKTGVISTVLGWAAGYLIMIFFEVPINQLQWYENPMVISALVTAGFLSLNKLMEVWGDRKKSLDTVSQKREEQHATYSDKLAELTSKERGELLGNLKEVYETEILFIKGQRNLKDAEAFEARIRAHKAVNEVNRCNGHIFILHSLLSKAGIEIPEFQVRSYDELMHGIDEEVNRYQKQMVIQMEELRGRNDGKDS
jgi:hypothetical protein